MSREFASKGRVVFVEESRVIPSPAGDGRVRIGAVVRYDGDFIPEEYWFDFPADLANEVDRSGSPWLALLSPLASKWGEDLTIDAPVDRILLEGVHENLRLWKAWEPERTVPGIHAPVNCDTTANGDRCTASFFSGGVDSFFTVLYHDAHPDTHARIDELITVWGFDIGVDRTDDIQYGRSRLNEVAEQLGRPRFDVWTNLRATRFGSVEWGRHTHGAALAAVGHFLSRRYRRIFIASSYSLANFHPWGSTPITDPNFSSSGLQFTHDGAGFERLEKVGYISTNQTALDYVHSCWRSGTYHNCSACASCLRTMMAFAIHGALSNCKTFDVSQFSLEKLRNMKLPDEDVVNDCRVIYLKKLPDTADPAIRDALLCTINANTRYFRRLRWFERWERARYFGWLFGLIKRNLILDKR